MNSAPIDQATYDRLIEMTGGELDFVDELVDTYIDDGRSQVDALRMALDRGDTDALVRAAHSLKSSSINVGALTLGDLCRTLEEAARGGPVSDAGEPVAEIATAFEEAVGALLYARAARPA